MASSNASNSSSDDEEEAGTSLETNFTILKCSQTWEIKNFSHCWLKPGEKLDSPTFSSESDSRIEWCLSLYPTGLNDDHKGNLSLYLTLLASYKAEIRVKYKFSIVNDKGEASNLYENTEGTTLLLNLEEPKPSCGADEFVSRSFLMNSVNGLLSDDKLTICCELSASTIIPSPLTRYSNNIRQTDRWGYTQVNVIEVSYSWTINNFSFCKAKTGEYIDSPVFFSKTDEKHQWKLRLYPYGQDENSKGNISIFVLPAAKLTTDVQVSIGFEIVTAQSREVNLIYSTPEKWAKDKDIGRGHPQFMNRDRILNELLSDDKLTIHSAVRYVTDTVNILEDAKPMKLETAKRRGVIDDFEILLKNKKFSDVSLVVDGQKLRAHKVILAARSPVFSAMFEYDSKECSKEEVEIIDIDYELLQEIVLFMYTGTTKNLAEMATALLAAADFYILEDLKFQCEQELCSKLSIENAADMLILADTYSAKQLKTQAMDLIDAHAPVVIDSVGFKKMSASHPQLLAEIALKRFLALKDN